MALTYGFYNSINSDRRYDALIMSRIFDGLITDGVYSTVGQHFIVTEAQVPGMFVVVGTGRAWFDHTWTHMDSPLYVPIGAAHAVLGRIDIVFLEIDTSVEIRANRIGVVSGEYALTPVPPTLTNTETLHQYPLAIVTVNPAVTEIGNADIQNRVGTVDCPFVISPVEHVTVDELLIQWEAQWEDWFDAIKGQLTEDPASNLYNMILNQEDFFKNHATYNAKVLIPADRFTPLDGNVSLSFLDHEGVALAYLANAVGEASCSIGLPPNLVPSSPIQMTIIFATPTGGTGNWISVMNFSHIYPGKPLFDGYSPIISTTLSGTPNEIESSRLYQSFLIEDGSEDGILPGDFVEGTMAHIKLVRNGTASGDTIEGTVRVYGLVVEYVVNPVVLN